MFYRANRRCRRAFAGLLLACAITIAHAAEVISIGAVPDMTPPLDMSDAARACPACPPTPRGMSTDFADAVAHALGAQLRWHFYPDRPAMIAALVHGDIDMATGATGADAGHPLTLSRAYLPISEVVVEALTKHAPTRRLAYVRDQTSADALRRAYPAMTLLPRDDMIGALLAVSFGEADVFVGDITAAAYTLSRFDLPNLSVTGLAKVPEGGYGFAFLPGRPASDALRQRVNAALDALPPSFALLKIARWNPGASAITSNRRIELTREESAWIDAHPVIPYSMLAQAAPLMFRDSRGEAAGIVVDELDAIARITGLRFEARVRDSTARMRADVTSGASLLAPFALSGVPVPSATPTVPIGASLAAIVTRAGTPALRDAAALADRRVAVGAGAPLGEIVRTMSPRARIVETRGLDATLRAVADGHADAAVVDLALANYLTGNPYRGVLVTSGVLSTNLIARGMAVASNQPLLLGILNRAIAALPPSELETIRTRWRLTEHPEVLWERRRPQVEVGALLGLALVLVLAGWALTLRVQIARRLAAERAMRAAKEEAETANRAKSTFLATMSHEIRTPMNAVLGLLELELRAPGERAASVRALSTAHDAARDLLGMIDDLLDVAKIEAERLVLAPAPFDVDAWIAGVVSIYEPAARAKGIGLVLTRADAQDAAPRWLLGDAQRLRQVLGNLLSNAIKFTDAGDVTLEYGIGPAEAGRRALTFAVADSGVGIAPERQASLFSPFAQAHDGGARRYGGTGLGLTICKRLVTMMAGDIGFTSEPGRGTRFTVHVELPEAAPLRPPPVRAEIASQAALTGVRVLVVDDHPANRIVLDGQLRLLGAMARLAENGHAALALWRADRAAFDAVLTDCSMPVMSGEELARAIRDDEAARAAPHAMPVIGLTANAQPEAAARAISAGMTVCLVKPIGLDALREALSSVARAMPGSSPEPPATPTALFDAASFDAFGDQRGALIDTLKAANAQDLADARAAHEARDCARLGGIAHRMKGAAAVIGAASFVQACAELQRACDEDDDGARIEASFDAFEAAALELDAALDAALARPAC